MRRAACPTQWQGIRLQQHDCRAGEAVRTKLRQANTPHQSSLKSEVRLIGRQITDVIATLSAVGK
jgi:hypothetical protein